MPGINKFLVFDEIAANLQDDATYEDDTQRLGGLSPGQARTIMHNKLFKQVSTMTNAIGEVLKDDGYTVYDTDANLVTNLKNSLKSADKTTVSSQTQTEYGVTTVDEVLLKNAQAYRATPVLEENTAYLLAQQEVAGNVQTYSNFFYDLFYSSHTAKVGYIDNRYLTYSGSLSAGATTLVGANINYSNFPINATNINSNYMAYTIDDGANREIIYMKNTDVFSSASYTGSYPATVNIATSGTYYFDMRGGYAGDSNAEGGRGGTLKFKTACNAGDVLVIEKVDGAGKGVKLKKNGTTIAVVGGGGSAGVGFIFTTPVETYPWKGGDGGSSVGESGTSNFGGWTPGGGANGATGGVGGTCGSYSATGKNAPDGSGGLSVGRNASNVCTQGNTSTSGGGGYAGGGGGFYNYYNSSMQGVTSAGGGSSYLDAGITAIENSRGTNGKSSEAILISIESVALKNPLQYSYTNPIIYRGNLSIDTTNHRASVKAINGVYVDALQLRVIIKNTQETFWDVASWIEAATDFTGIGATVAFGTTQNVDESAFVQMSQTQYSSGTRKQIRVEATNTQAVNYAVVTFNLTKIDDAAYIYKMLGVVN